MSSFHKNVCANGPYRPAGSDILSKEAKIVFYFEDEHRHHYLYIIRLVFFLVSERLSSYLREILRCVRLSVVVASSSAFVVVLGLNLV